MTYKYGRLLGMIFLFGTVAISFGVSVDEIITSAEYLPVDMGPISDILNENNTFLSLCDFMENKIKSCGLWTLNFIKINGYDFGSYVINSAPSVAHATWEFTKTHPFLTGTTLITVWLIKRCIFSSSNKKTSGSRNNNVTIKNY